MSGTEVPWDTPLKFPASEDAGYNMAEQQWPTEIPRV
jgi:hypothetical protein